MTIVFSSVLISLLIVASALVIVNRDLLFSGDQATAVDFRFPKNKAQFPDSTSPTTPPTTGSPSAQISDIPELYPGIEWQTFGTGPMSFSTRGNAIVTVDGYYFESASVTAYPSDFFTHYEQWLTTNHWDLTEFAEGPEGRSEAYQKNSYYIRFGIRILSKDPLSYQAFVEHN